MIKFPTYVLQLRAYSHCIGKLIQSMLLPFSCMNVCLNIIVIAKLQKT